MSDHLHQGGGAFDVHVWTAQPKNIPPWRWPALMSCLHPIERERAQSLRNPLDRRSHLLAHALKRTALGSALNLPAKDLTFEVTSHGRPVLGSPNRGALFFSLSHTRELVVCAVTSDTPVGIDAESLLPQFADLDLLTGYVVLPADPLQGVASPDRAVRQFYFYWTVLEAYWKARGQGLSSSHPALKVESEGRVSRVYEDSGASAPHTESALSLDAPPGMVISMVLDVPPARLMEGGLRVRRTDLYDAAWQDEAFRSHRSPERVLPC